MADAESFNPEIQQKTVHQVETNLHNLSTNESKLIAESNSDFEAGIVEVFGDASKDDSDDSGWDTDLECDDEMSTSGRRSFDLAGKSAYLRACKTLNVTPISSLLQNIENKEISLAHHGLGPRGAMALARALAKSTTVEKLDLEENRLQEEGAESFAKMLKDNCYITELNLAGNAMSSRGAKAMGEIIGYSNYIRKLDLSFNNFIDKDGEALSKGLAATLTLKELRLSHNSFSESGGELLAPGIAANYSVEYLDLSWNHLRMKGAIAICKAMGENASIRVLDLSWNGFADDGAAAMGNALRHNSTLKELDLSHNRITKKGAFALSKGLAVNDALRVLKIGFNPFESDGTMALLKAMRNNAKSAMEELHLNNITVGKGVIEFLDEYMKHNPNFQITLGVSPTDRREAMDDDDKNGKIKSKNQLLTILKEYLIEKRLRAVDLFNCLDKDKSRSVSPEELIEGLKRARIPLTDSQLKRLITLLDKDGDGMIDYSEFAAVNM